MLDNVSGQTRPITMHTSLQAEITEVNRLSAEVADVSRQPLDLHVLSKLKDIAHLKAKMDQKLCETRAKIDIRDSADKALLENHQQIQQLNQRTQRVYEQLNTLEASRPSTIQDALRLNQRRQRYKEKCVLKDTLKRYDYELKCLDAGTRAIMDRGGRTDAVTLRHQAHDLGQLSAGLVSIERDLRQSIRRNLRAECTIVTTPNRRVHEFDFVTPKGEDNISLTRGDLSQLPNRLSSVDVSDIRPRFPVTYAAQLFDNNPSTVLVENQGVSSSWRQYYHLHQGVDRQGRALQHTASAQYRVGVRRSDEARDARNRAEAERNRQERALDREQRIAILNDTRHLSEVDPHYR